MTEWMVRLRGHSADLEELPDLFRSDQLNVREDGGDYYLRSSDFNVLAEAHEVREKAAELLPLMTGIVKLHYKHSEPLIQAAVIKVEDDGTRRETKYSSATMRGKFKVSLGKHALVTGPTEAELWMNLSQQDENVMDALRFFEEKTTWWSLRKTYEAIASDFNGQETLLKKQLGLGSVKEIKRFETWANYHVHGERYKKKKKKPPNQNKDPQLSLPQAESFIRGILLQWLRWKQSN